MTTTENPFGIAEIIARVGAENEGLYLTDRQQHALWDCVLWNAALELLAKVTDYNPAALREQYGDGTNFRDDRETLADLENLQLSVMRDGVRATISKNLADAGKDYVLAILPGARWATFTAEGLTIPEDNYAPPVQLADVVAVVAARVMVAPDGHVLLSRIRGLATTAGNMVRLG